MTIMSEMSCNFLSDTRSIINGYDAPDRPYYVRLDITMYSNGTRDYCGGTIISSGYVLTAAHCLYKMG